MKWLQHIQRYDELSYIWLSTALRRSTKAMLARTISLSGDGWMYAVICAALYLHGHPNAALLFTTLLLAYALEVPIYLVLKNTLKRQRPHQRLKICAVIKASDKFSFPSGHTAAAFVFATVTSVIMPDAAWLVFAWASAIGLSRVALGVHYPTDIVAGAVLGGSLGVLGLFLAGVA